MRLDNMWNALFLLTISFTCVAAKYNCNAGCSLDPSVSGQPVCGADGFTYANECLAFCQGVKYSSGVCAGEGDRVEQIDLSGQTEVITREIMNRFAKESFRFVTKVIEYSMEPIRDDFPYSSDNTFSPQDIPNGFNAVRVTSEGYKFISKVKAIAQILGPTASLQGNITTNAPRLRKRDLVVLGVDTRAKISDTTIMPYRAIGSLDFEWGESACTVTMISRTSALTAGHCIYDKAVKKQRPMTKFAPARFNDPSQADNTSEPFGTFEFDHATTFQGFIDTAHQYFDMGVITFKKRQQGILGFMSVFPGDVVGALSIDRVNGDSTAVNDTRLSTMTVTGYPYDVAKGQMTTSGGCPTGMSSPDGTYIYHTCDTEAGMSGSALLTSGNIILGVHNGWHEPPSGLINGGTVLTPEYFDSVVSWAKIAGQSPQACTCSSLGSRTVRRLICALRNFGACVVGSQNG